MSDLPNADNPGGEPAPAPATTGGYSAEYVKSLRDENAAWRTKLRDTESTLTQVRSEAEQIKLETTVGSVLKERNLNVDAKWIKMEEGQSVEQAVDKFLIDYPQMAAEMIPQSANDTTNRGTQGPMKTQKKQTNSPGHQQNDVKTIKADPVARARLRDQYRSMLKDGHQGTTI